MRVIRYFLCSVFLISPLIAANGNLEFFHNTPEGVIRGDEVKIEVMLNTATANLYDLNLFYREIGEVDYKMLPMRSEGLLYYAKLNTSQFTTGQMQYYIGYEGALGEIGTMPEEMPQLNPLVMQIAPERSFQEDSPIEVVILSPLPDEVLSEEDLVVAVSVFSEGEEIDYPNTRLIIDGVNIRNNIDFSEGIVTFTPPPGYEMRSGFHNIEVQVFDIEGRALGQKGWSFKSIRSAAPKTSTFFRGSVFLENRYQSIGPSGPGYEPTDNFFRAGGEISGKYNDLDYTARLVVSSEEESIRQPVNRYAASLRYNFSKDNNIFLYGGDFNPYFNPIVLQDKRVRGIHAGLAYGFFTLDYINGQLNRAINGQEATLFSSDSSLSEIIAVGGRYAQNMWAIRPGFRFGESVWWTLNLVNAKDDPKSIEIGSNANESLSIGTDLNMNFDRRRILIDASFQTSVNNTNAGQEEISWDTLVVNNEDLADNSAAKSAYDFLESTGWLSLTQGLNLVPSYAMQFDLTLRYFRNNLKFRYYRMDRDFKSPGNPYLLRDVSGFHISDNIRLFENQVYLTLFYKNYTTNRSREKEATDNNELGASISYFPSASLPSLTVSYASLDRSNDLTPADSSFFMVDNSTMRLSFNTSYMVDLSGTKNTFMLNYTTYGRDEEVNPSAQSEFNLYGIGLRTNFSIPLISRINYSITENTIGIDTKTTSNISTLLLGLDYLMDGVSGGDIFKPFVSYRLQQVETTTAAGANYDTDRNNLTIGLAYQSPVMGIFSLRYDLITYGNKDIYDFSDTVLNARYSYHF